MMFFVSHSPYALHWVKSHTGEHGNELPGRHVTLGDSNFLQGTNYNHHSAAYNVVNYNYTHSAQSQSEADTITQI